MRVLFDVLRDGISAINTPAAELAKAREQVATGRRINAPSDDPLGVRQVVSDYAAIGGFDAYTRTGQSASARLSVVDSVLNDYVDKITAATVAAQSARGPHITDTATAAAASVRSLRDGLLSDLNTKFDGAYLFSGTRPNAAAYANTGSGWTYQGNNDTVQVDIAQGRLVSVSFDGQALAQGSDATDVLTTLDDLATAIETGDTVAVDAGIATLGRAFDRALVFQGRLGADERAVDDATVRLGAMKQGAITRKSSLENVDLAEAITRMSTADTSYKAALGAVSTVERQSLLDYLR